MEYDEMIHLIQAKGNRLTLARKHVIQLLYSHTNYLGAYDIHHLLEAEDIHIGVSSVYRVLDMLKALGLLKQEEFGVNGERFRLELQHSQHLHHHQLICSECGRSEEWSGNCPVSAVTKKLESDSGYQIEDHWLRFFGRCPDCLTQKKRPHTP